MKKYEIRMSHYAYDTNMVSIPETQIMLANLLVINGDSEFSKRKAIKLAKQIALKNFDEHFTKHKNKLITSRPNQVEVLDCISRKPILKIKTPKYKCKADFTRCDLHDWKHAEKGYKEIIRPQYVKKVKRT